MPDVLIPPWVRPESPETIRMIDDATVALQPAFGRGMTQRGIFADPRWGLRRRYRGLRSDEKSAILTALNESRGQFNTIRVTPHTPIRGSFPAAELFSNSSFASGTTGWTALTGTTISVSDRVMRVLANTGGSQPEFKQAVTLTQYAPHILRCFIQEGAQTVGLSIGPVIDSPNVSATGYTTSRGMATATCVPYSGASSDQYPAVLLATSGYTAGAYYSVPYTSLARCALIDNGANLLQRSDEFDNAYWGKAAVTVTANLVAAPDGASTADSIVENSATSTHEIALAGALTVSSAVADYAFAIAIKGGTRGWARIHLRETTSSTVASAYINLSTGAVGTTATGANWANLRTFVVDLGNGWFYVCIVARKTNAATGLDADVQIATANGTNSYTGNGTGNIYLWRATLSQSSVPVRLVQSTSAAVSATAQTGSSLSTKGWPVSTNGLLLTGDWFEINGELKQLTAPVNSDAAGLAYMQFRPGLAGSPADNDPIIIFEPFGRFIYPGTREFENLFGIYGDCEMNLEEVYS